jgi:hypothetical protein
MGAETVLKRIRSEGEAEEEKRQRKGKGFSSLILDCINKDRTFTLMQSD